MGKSTGQIIGTVVGGVIGAFVGYPMLGASLGGMLGGIVDPPKGPDIKGPRLNDLTVQSSSYGQVIPRVYGTVALAGNVFWIENNALAEHEKTEEQGGKGGGGGATTTSYWYSSTFALGLCEGPIEGIRRIWVSGKLIYDAGSSDVNTIIASNMQMMDDRLFASSLSLKGTDVQATADASPKWTLYYGDETQTANPRMEATLGVGNVPGYRGLAYIVFEDFDLTNYGNSLMGAQFKVEVITDASYASSNATPIEYITPDTGDLRICNMVRLSGDFIRQTNINALAWNYDLYSVSSQSVAIGATVPVMNSESSIPTWHDSSFQSKLPLVVMQADVDIVPFILYRDTPSRLLAYDAAGVLVMDTGQVPAATLPYEGYFAAVRDSEIYLCVNTNTRPIYKLPLRVEQVSYFGPSASTASIVNSSQIGVSQNYVFTLDYIATSPTSCTVRRFNRSDLSVDAVWTQSVSGSYAMLYVESDDVVYTMSNQSGNDILYMWTNGTAIDTGIRYSGTNSTSNRLAFASPLLGYIYDSAEPTTLTPCFRSIVPGTVPLADIVEAECLKAGLLTASDLDVTALTQEVRGYRVTQVAAIRAGLEPLQGAWPFDVIQNGYKIKFIPRGGSSVGTVTKEELGAAAPGDNDVISVTESREMDAQLARKAVITFLDVNREYDVSEQSAERLNTDAVNIRSIEMPIVLSADEGAQIVERLLYLWWLERRDLSFTLPPTWLHLQPADVVTIQSANATFEARLTSCQYLPDGRIEVDAKYNDAPVYVSTAVGATPPYTGQSLTLAGPTAMYLLDVPCLDSRMNGSGILAACSGYTSGWPGSTILRSDDSGETWTAVHGFLPPGCVSGIANTALGSGRTDIIDTKNTVNISLINGTLYGVTEIQLYGGSNLFAVGSTGRWEIVGAKTVTEETDGSYTLSVLTRGRFGTEQYMDDHAVFDTVVLLDVNALRFVGLPSSLINMEKLWRGVTNGRSIDSADSTAFTYSAVNLKPLSPVYLNGSRSPVDSAWTLTWTRRSRTPVEAFSGSATPIGEDSEAYEVEIWDSAFTSLKRTITGLSSASATYTLAMATADFGSAQGTLGIKVFQMSSLIGRGFPLVETITRQTTAYLDYAVFASNFNGADASTIIVDITGKSPTCYGNAAISTSQSKFGGASLKADGTGDFVEIANHSGLNIGTSKLTMAAWVYIAGNSSLDSDGKRAASIFNTFSGTSTVATISGWNFGILGDGSTTGIGILLDSWLNGNGTLYRATTTVSQNAWHYIEATVDGSGVRRIFLDGTLISGSTTTIGSGYVQFNSNSNPMRIGMTSNTGFPLPLNGYIDSGFVLKGECLHTESYTAPTTEL